MTPSLEELAEDTLAFLLPSPMFRPVTRDGYVYVEGPATGWVTRVRRVDFEAVRAQASRRRARRLEWWLGWSAPSTAADELLERGLVPDEVPTLTGMTLTEEPPRPDRIVVRDAEPEEVADLEHAVWGGERRPASAESPVIYHVAAEIDGAVAGVARGIDMRHGVALMGGVVLPAFRGRGVYRALVHARWRRAAARGTPLLVVQAGAMSAPILDGLGFRRHGELRLFVDLEPGST